NRSRSGTLLSASPSWRWQLPMNRRRSSNLAGRVSELEKRYRHSEGGRFYLIWGTNDADCQRKLEEAKARGDVMPGDRYDARTCPDPKWPSRWTTLDLISREELEIMTEEADRMIGPVGFSRSNSYTQFSDAELGVIYAEGLPRGISFAPDVPSIRRTNLRRLRGYFP